MVSFSPTPTRAPQRLWIAVACWCVLVAVSSAALVVASKRPGVAAATPATMPAALTEFGSAGRATLVIALHPKCPCSRSTLANLQTALASAAGACDVVVLAYRPFGAGEDWAKTDLTDRVKSLGNPRIVDDVEGRLAASLGAHTSGHVVLYGTHGRLLFSGGVTPGRGHEGWCPALQALTTGLVTPVESKPPAAAASAVFGCPLTPLACAEGACAP